ncbi:MAG: FAD:protein FMN transferase [Gemmatimonadetes bacterium]|nr:FAD:protein FMN transferase [Gemmatimonadota bacterium]
MWPDRDLPPSRRTFLSLGLGLFVVAAVPFAARRRARLVRRTTLVMGSTCDIVVLDPRVERAEAAIDAAFAELARVDRTMSRFKATSDVGRANLGAHAAPVLIGADTAAVIARGLSWARATDGAFDPAIGKVVELWDVAHRYEPPPAPAVRRLAGRQFHRAIEVGTERGEPVVHFGASDMHLDLGGIAAGWGVDRAVEALRTHGIRDALVNASGDIYALGRNEAGDPWRIGVRSPADPGALVGTVEVSDAAVATSGDYEQYFRYRGTCYHHLMDPGTAAPARTDLHSTTVVAERCVDADAGSTAAFVMGAERAAAALAAHGVRLVSSA